MLKAVTTLKIKCTLLGAFLLSGSGFTLLAEEKEAAVLSEEAVKIVGEIPDDWEVGPDLESPRVERWVELKDGTKKKVLMPRFVLKPKTVGLVASESGENLSAEGTVERGKKLGKSGRILRVPVWSDGLS